MDQHHGGSGRARRVLRDGGARRGDQAHQCRRDAGCENLLHVHSLHPGNGAADRKTLLRRNAFGECEQIRIQSFLVGISDAVRTAFVDDELRVLDQLGGRFGSRVNRHNLIVAAMNHERRHI